MKSVRRLPLAPFLLALYAVIALFANNIDQISGSLVIRSLAISIIGAGVAVGAFMLVSRNWHRAALAASWVILLFFSYSHIYGVLKQVEISSILMGRHRFLAPIWILLLVFGLYFISKRIKEPIQISGPMNLIGADICFNSAAIDSHIHGSFQNIPTRIGAARPWQL